MLLLKKVALVTGATSPLGESVVQGLSSKFTMLRTGTKPINQPDYFAADLTDFSQAQGLIAWGLGLHHKIDCLVCCAGGVAPKPKLDDSYQVSTEDMLAVFNRNFITTLNSCRSVIPYMLKNQSGRIILVGSNVVGNPRDGALMSYCVAKAAIHEYTKHLSAQLKNSGIKVNCVSPGGISDKPEDISHQSVVSAIDLFCSFDNEISGQVLIVSR